MNDLNDSGSEESIKAISKIKLISQIMRILVWLSFLLVLTVLSASMFFSIDVKITVLDDVRLPQQAEEYIHWLLLPLYLTIFAGLICLERFFSQLHKEQFFNRHCRNYLMSIAWLYLFATLYTPCFQLLINLFFADNTNSLDVNIAPVRLLGAGLLLVIAWLMTLAEEINRENKEFV